jgi:predicted Zn-dependent protease
MIRLFFALSALLIIFTTGCSEDGDLNAFSVQQDLELGQQTDADIRSKPNEFPIIAAGDAPAAYDYLQGMVDEIVRDGMVAYADIFPYQVAIIDEDIQNAFATPGGFLYVYTGLINTLNTESELAGVLAHEIAHAAARHSTDQLTANLGLATLISIVTGGDSQAIGQITRNLLSLRFSRDDEEEADALSVDYLCNTQYAANGAAGFFETIQDGNSPPAFLSSHPNPEDRVEDINARAAEKNCDTTESASQTRFQEFQDSL